jgi:hypothetical protein
VKGHFWGSCGKDGCNFGPNNNQRVDPVLKPFPNCPLMFTMNTDVPNGQANGSCVFLQHINVKPGKYLIHIQLENGVTVRAFFVSQIATLKLQHEMDDIVPNQFNATPETFSFTAKLEIEGCTNYCNMKGDQFPVISNTATTGHKLQGYTATTLLANDWYYGENWTYVVLSRVRTMAGLYMMQPLSKDLTKYAMSDKMKQMLAEFEQGHLLQPIDDDAYRQMLQHEN